MHFKSRGIISAALAAAVFLSAAVFSAFADDTATGREAVSLSEHTEISGDGSKENPYLIRTEADLSAIADGEIANAPDSYYELQNDISITAETWTPIGESAAFQGCFDGKGYTISNIIVANDGDDYNGLFGKNKGTIKNLTVSGSVSGKNYVGILAGYNSGTIEGCLTRGEASGTDYVGGLAGENTNGTIYASGSSASVGGEDYVGGLVGNSVSNVGGTTALISNCYSQGNVTGSNKTGGLVGCNYASGSNRSVIRECYASGTVNEGGGAGLVGENSGRIYNSYSNDKNNKLDNTDYKNGFSVSAAELSNLSTFYMWDFDSIWALDEGYPHISLRGEAAEIEFDGRGDEEEPYCIETEEQLYALAVGDAVTGTSVYYRLLNDMEITAKFWTPIGEYDAFSGIFDGNGHTISGVKNFGTGYRYVGFFGSNKGVIKNLTVIGEVSGQSYVGMLTGYNSGTIEGCLTMGAVKGAASYVGGLVGENFNGTISASGSTARVSGKNCVGGLVGRNYSDYCSRDTSITNCYAHGSVTANGKVGGLVGHNYHNRGSYTSVIEYCYSVGAVSGNSYVGGIVGSNNGTVTRLFYDSEASGRSDTAKGTPTATQAMKLPDTYDGWDFESVWSISGETYGGYPHLRTVKPDERAVITGITLDGDEITGSVWAATYKNGGELTSVKQYPASRNVTAVFDKGVTGDYVKILWWNDKMKPMDEARIISLE